MGETAFEEKRRKAKHILRIVILEDPQTLEKKISEGKKRLEGLKENGIAVGELRVDFTKESRAGRSGRGGLAGGEGVREKKECERTSREKRGP